MQSFETLPSAVHRFAEETPQKTALASRVDCLSYGDLSVAVSLFTSTLDARGYERGDIIGYAAEKTPEAFVALLGIMSLGCTAYPINLKLLAAEMQSVLDFINPRAVFYATAVKGQLSGLDFPCHNEDIVEFSYHSSTGLSINNVAVEKMKYLGGTPTVNTAPTEPAFLNFTSGSTGMPKAALTTHGNIYWNARSTIEWYGLTKDDVYMCMFPIHLHPHDIVHRALYLGGTAALCESVSPKAMAACMADFGVTCISAVASIYAGLIRYRRRRSFESASLRLAESGGMPVQTDLIDEFRNYFGIPVTPAWGSTETAGVVFSDWQAPEPAEHAMGRALPYYDVQIRNSKGGACGIDEPGELCISGPGVCPGYYGLDEINRERFHEGWLCTGDIVQKNAHGRVFFISRKTGMMKVDGHQVFNTEIEEVLRSHPGVENAAVIKVEDPVRGEQPKAFIELAPSANLTQANLMHFCRDRLSAYKIPKKMVFVDRLPQTGSGKILYSRFS